MQSTIIIAFDQVEIRGRPTPGATPQPLESARPSARGLQRALVRADWEWPDERQNEIAVQGTSVSSTTCVGMFGLQAG